MRVLTEGHKYVADNYEDNQNGQTIQFIEKAPKSPGSTELETLNDGTTNEELISVLIDRITYLDNKFPCFENKMALLKLSSAKLWLEKRTADRIANNTKGTNKL